MPVSEHCKGILEQPVSREACLDFRATRATVMCDAWRRMDQEKQSFGKAIKASWDQEKKECATVGVFSPEPVEPRLAVDLVDIKTGERKGVIALMEDDNVSVCAEKAPCYMTERPAPELYYIAQAFYSGMGYGLEPHGG